MISDLKSGELLISSDTLVDKIKSDSFCASVYTTKLEGSLGESARRVKVF